jgi:hypothetical protein
MWLAGTCRNRTYQPPCDGLSGFEDRAGHQTRTLPCAREVLILLRFSRTCMLLASRRTGLGDHLVTLSLRCSPFASSA